MLTPYQPPPWRLRNWRNVPHEKIRNYQGQVLSRFIKEQVYPFSAHYRRLFDAHGLGPNDINNLDDLVKIPLTSKRDLLATDAQPDRAQDFVLTPPALREYLEQDPELRAREYHELSIAERVERDRFLWEYFPVHANHTTGRSAAPTPFWFTRRDLYDYTEKMRRAFEFGRPDPLSKTMVLWPFTPVAHQAFWCMPIYALNAGLRMIHTGGGKAAGTETLLDLADLHKPQTLCIMPGYAFHFLRRAKQAGTRFENLSWVCIGGEKCTNEMRRKMHEGFVELGADSGKLHVTVTYGSTEMRGGAVECPAPSGDFSSTWYHTQPDMEIWEIVDPDSGEPVPEGETGEVAYTCLDGRGSVLLRYRTADLAVGGITTQPCPVCGATVPRISNDLQRVSNLKDLQLTKLKGNLVDLGSIGPVLHGVAEVEEFQVELRKENNDRYGLDQVIVHVSAQRDVSYEVITKRVRTALRKAIELEPSEVVFHSLDDMLERIGMETALKEVRLVDNRPADSRI